MIDVAELCQNGIQEWLATKPCTSLHKWHVSSQQQLEYENTLDTLLSDMQQFLAKFPQNAIAKKHWKEKGFAYIERWIKTSPLPILDGMSDQTRALFQHITVAFLRDVRKFDPTLSLADTMQALRNVWIIAILQCLFGKHVGYHQAMFAYSMLYPYSDNYLDDAHVTMAEKRSFNDWFTKRLHGETVEINNEHEKKISALVEMIESEFPRSEYDDVYTSLYMIQAAQIRSLTQQDGKRTCTYEELLDISYQKGGTSVVADGMLIDGELTQEQLHFCMQYGFMLQIGDDIQDGSTDASTHHQTLISTQIETIQDAIVTKLMQYTIDILSDGVICNDEALCQFVLQDCLYLIFFALIKKDAICISDALKAKIVPCLPVSLAYLRQKEQSQSKQRTEIQGEKKAKALLPFSYTQKEWWERIDALLCE